MAKPVTGKRKKRPQSVAEDPEIDCEPAKKKATSRVPCPFSSSQQVKDVAPKEKPEVNKKKRKPSWRLEKSLAAEELTKDVNLPTEKPALGKKNKKKKKQPQHFKTSAGNISSGNNTVIVGGLPYDSTEAMLSHEFRKFGKMQKILIPKDRQTGRVRGFAFITFKSKDGAEAGLKLDGSSFGGRRLTARLASEKPDQDNGAGKDTTKGNNEFSLFVASLPHNITEKSVRKHFADAGIIETLKLPLNEAGQSKGYAFITFQDKKSMANALDLNGSDCQGRSIVVRRAGNIGDGDGKGQGRDGKGRGNSKGKGSGKGTPELTVFVQGLDRSITEQRLRKVFSKCGEITHLKLPMWTEGESRGFAFVSYTDKSSVDKALQLNGDNSMSYNDCYMSVKKAIHHDQAEKSRQQRKEKKDRTADANEQSAEPKRNSNDARDTPKETGAIVKSTGKRVEFDSDVDDE